MGRSLRGTGTSVTSERASAAGDCGPRDRKVAKIFSCFYIVLLICRLKAGSSEGKTELHEVAAVNFASLVVLLAPRLFVQPTLPVRAVQAGLSTAERRGGRRSQPRWLSLAASVRRGWVAVPASSWRLGHTNKFDGSRLLRRFGLAAGAGTQPLVGRGFSRPLYRFRRAHAPHGARRHWHRDLATRFPALLRLRTYALRRSPTLRQTISAAGPDPARAGVATGRFECWSVPVLRRRWFAVSAFSGRLGHTNKFDSIGLPPSVRAGRYADK